MTVDLTGTWQSDGYQCPAGIRHTELVSIRHDEQRIVATKLTGDPCVPAGFETFSGRLPEGSSVAAINWTGGTPRAPASAQFPGFLEVLDHDTLRAGSEAWNDQIFVRVN
jgi:hypothetical protein